MVTVQIKDMEGGPDGLSNTATATITLSDINDNAPTFKKATVSYLQKSWNDVLMFIVLWIKSLIV